MEERILKKQNKLVEVQRGVDNQPKFTVNADDMEILRLAKMQM